MVQAIFFIIIVKKTYEKRVVFNFQVLGIKIKNCMI